MVVRDSQGWQDDLSGHIASRDVRTTPDHPSVGTSGPTAVHHRTGAPNVNFGRSPYLRVIAVRPRASQHPRMKKRILATFLWFFAGWYAGAVIAYALDVSAILGPILGVAAAGLITGVTAAGSSGRTDPRHRRFRRARPRPRSRTWPSPDRPSVRPRSLGPVTRDTAPRWAATMAVMPMSDAPGFVALPPIRGQARAAVARAWIPPIASGALPAFHDDAARPAVGIERPANPAYGDFATNLAMQLARPLRHGRRSRSPRPSPPRSTAEAAARSDRVADRVGRGRAARVRQPPARDAAFEATVAGDPRRSAGLGPRRRRPTPRTVNVEFVSANPTGPLTHRQRARAPSSATCSAASSRPAASASRASTTSTIPAPRSTSSARRCSRSGAASRSPTTATTATTSTTSRPRCPDDVGAAATAPGADGADVVGRWASERVRAGIEASLERARRPLRRLDDRGLAARRGLGRSGDRAPAGAAATSTSRTARCGSARRRSATTRTGSSSGPPASRPTSRPTSATSSRSSAAASTT